MPALRRQLIGEFDAPNPQAVRDLARLYVRFGFGAEARAVLAAFAEAEVEDRALIGDLARIVEGGAAAPDGPLAVADACPGYHGLWLALGGAAPAFRDEAGFADAQAAFAALPPDLRAMLAPGFVGRLLDAGRPREARVIHDTAMRPGQAADAALALAAARLSAAEGRPLEAAKALNALIEGDGHASVETLAELARVVLDAGLPVPDRVVTDLRAAALQYRGAPEETGLRRLLVQALARQSALPDAIAEARAAMGDLPQAADGFAALAVSMLGQADPARVGAAAYTGTVLAAADLLAQAPADDPARTAVAARLIGLGLPDPALAALGPAVAAGDSASAAPRRRGASAPRPGRRRPRGPRRPRGHRRGRAARPRLRALRRLRPGLHRASPTAACPGRRRPMPGPPAPGSAPAPPRPDPARRAMADYMSAGSGRAPAPAPAEDPAALAPEAAFLEPVPALDRPTLSAARRLLATGPKVDSFVQGVLADTPAADSTAGHTKSA